MSMLPAVSGRSTPPRTTVVPSLLSWISTAESPEGPAAQRTNYPSTLMALTIQPFVSP